MLRAALFLADEDHDARISDRTVEFVHARFLRRLEHVIPFETTFQGRLLTVNVCQDDRSCSRKATD